jgi:hypothetical protein
MVASVERELRFPLPFWTPYTPDLGCFVRQGHAFQPDYNYFLWLEPAPWELTPSGPVFLPHQTYFRIKCGEAAFYQRCAVNMVNYPSNPTTVIGRPPDWVLGGDFPPSPSDWLMYPPQSGPKDYWFAGHHRNPSVPNWTPDAAVGHSYDIYANGTLSTVGFDDTGGDRDFDDLVLEVAVVYRRHYFELFELSVEAESVETFDRDILPRYLVTENSRPPEAPHG